MHGQIKNVSFTMLLSHLGKEVMWQARILSIPVMMLSTIMYPTEVWKWEIKALRRMQLSGTLTWAKQGKHSTCLP